MQDRGKLPILWQFTLFVVSSRITVGICSLLALRNRNPLTFAQKGFLHDKERMVLTSLINEKNDRPHSYERSRSFAYKVSLTVIPHSNSNSISISLLDCTVIFRTRLLNITRSSSSSIFPVCSSLVTSSIRYDTSWTFPCSNSISYLFYLFFSLSSNSSILRPP